MDFIELNDDILEFILIQTLANQSSPCNSLMFDVTKLFVLANTAKGIKGPALAVSIKLMRKVTGRGHMLLANDNSQLQLIHLNEVAQNKLYLYEQAILIAGLKRFLQRYHLLGFQYVQSSVSLNFALIADPTWWRKNLQNYGSSRDTLFETVIPVNKVDGHQVTQWLKNQDYRIVQRMFFSRREQVATIENFLWNNHLSLQAKKA